MKQNKDREEFEKILFNFGTFYEELPQTVRGRKRALKEMDKLWKMFQSYTQKKVKEALNNILEENHCDLDGTYDYDGIAQDVIDLIQK